MNWCNIVTSSGVSRNSCSHCYECINQVCIQSLSRTARVLSFSFVGLTCGILLVFAVLESTFQCAEVNFVESMFSQKNITFARLSLVVLSFLTFL